MALHHSHIILTAEQRIVALNLNICVRGGTALSQRDRNVAERRLLTVYTAVDPDFRGRRLATALKLKLIRHARAYNIDFLAAENDERNVAMWRINERLGYDRLADLRPFQFFNYPGVLV